MAINGKEDKAQNKVAGGCRPPHVAQETFLGEVHCSVQEKALWLKLLMFSLNSVTANSLSEIHSELFIVSVMHVHS